MSPLKKLGIRIVGLVPIMLHNGRLANPLDEYAKAMKAITSKKKKTDADLEELARLEFMGGLYLDEDHEPCIPDHVIEGYFGAAAKKIRMSKEGKAGVMSRGNWPLLYDGPRDPAELWAMRATYADTRGAKVTGKKVMRTRPIFSKWSLEFEVVYDPNIINLESIKDILAAGSSTHGIGDYTPKFGRFKVEWIKDLGAETLAA